MLPKVALDSGSDGIRTRNLLIASTAPHRYNTPSSHTSRGPKKFWDAGGPPLGMGS